MSDDRDDILKRRKRFIKSALLTVSIAAVPGAACETEPEVCLSVVADTEETDGEGDATSDDTTSDGDVQEDSAPEVCLSPPPEDTVDDGDAEETTEADITDSDTTDGDTINDDAAPEVCLSPPIEDIEEETTEDSAG